MGITDFSLQAKVDRFEGRYAVLRNDISGEFRWPITRLPESVNVGEYVTLQVADRNFNTSTNYPSVEVNSIKNEDKKDEKMRRLLEELIN